MDRIFTFIVFSFFDLTVKRVADIFKKFHEPETEIIWVSGHSESHFHFVFQFLSEDGRVQSFVFDSDSKNYKWTNILGDLEEIKRLFWICEHT